MPNLPKDPAILLSVVNTKLRDYYKSLEHMCDDLEVEQNTIVSALQGIDYHYDLKQNQFI